MSRDDVMKYFDIEETWMDRLIHPVLWLWVRVKDRWDDLRYRCQRFKKGYSDRDVSTCRFILS